MTTVARDTISGIEPSRRTVVATPTRARWADKTLVIHDPSNPGFFQIGA